MALAIFADLAPLGDLGERGCSVCGSFGGAVDLRNAITIKARCHVVCLTHPIAWMRWALWDLTGLRDWLI